MQGRGCLALRIDSHSYLSNYDSDMGGAPKVGIPRALLYYEYYPMWRTFFENLGAEVVLSPTTTKDIVAGGSSRVVAETCLPVKVFMGHVISLADKCDCVFVPAVRSMERAVHNCSKFLGLPDMTKAAVPEAPPILEGDIDLDKGTRELYQAIYTVGRRFTWNPLKVKRAAEAAWQANLAFQAQMRARQQSPLQAIEEFFDETPTREAENSKADPPGALTVALIGHPYLLYDEFVNYRLFSHLRALGCRVVTPEMAPETGIGAAIAKLVEKAYWTYEGEVVGAGGYYLQGNADGVIALIPFGCGPDSLMISIVQHCANELRRPFMTLTLDEHSSETGLLTRVEAFIDMIQRRKRN